jgi:hypothetical protein
VSSIAGQVPEGFRHESGQETMLFGDRPNHPFEKGVAVGGGQSIGRERSFKLLKSELHGRKEPTYHQQV